MVMGVVGSLLPPVRRRKPASSIVVNKVRALLSKYVTTESKYVITDPLFLLCVFQVHLPFLVHVWHVNQVLCCTRTSTRTHTHTHAHAHTHSHLLPHTLN